MKAFKYFSAIAALALAMTMAGSCAKPDAEAVHSDNTIRNIYIARPSGDGQSTGQQIEGQINDETGEVYFIIPRRQQADWQPQLTKLRVYATVDYDVFITPSLSGLKDLSAPFTITATSATGAKRSYTLFVEFAL